MSPARAPARSSPFVGPLAVGSNGAGLNSTGGGPVAERPTEHWQSSWMRTILTQSDRLVGAEAAPNKQLDRKRLPSDLGRQTLGRLVRQQSGRVRAPE